LDRIFSTFKRGNIMGEIILFHGTSATNAKKIELEGFIPDKKYNWNVKSKKGFVYLSLAYAPFYAMTTGEKELALIKVKVYEGSLYPEDDFLMTALGKSKYTQAELNEINFENYKKFWKESLKYLGNVAVKPEKVRIMGIRYFNGKNLLYKCDPVICQNNFKIMGDYYYNLTEWIYSGKNIEEFCSFDNHLKANSIKLFDMKEIE
jgi:hypothetical protein